jgi:hypothetical protein
VPLHVPELVLQINLHVQRNQRYDLSGLWTGDGRAIEVEAKCMSIRMHTCDLSANTLGYAVLMSFQLPLPYLHTSAADGNKSVNTIIRKQIKQGFLSGTSSI